MVIFCLQFWNYSKNGSRTCTKLNS